MTIEIRILRDGDDAVLQNVATGVFDDPIDESRVVQFLRDPRHHLVVAIEDGGVVGMVSAVDYVHPDKTCPELWINEVGVAGSHRGYGMAKNLLSFMLEVGREIGCAEAWVLTERSNNAGMRLYSSVGGRQSPEESVLFTFRLVEPQ